MYENILIATDGSEIADKALSHGLALAKELNASVVCVNVTEHQFLSAKYYDVVAFKKAQAEWTNKMLAEAAEKAKQLDLACKTILIEDQHPAEGIIEAAKSNECDLVVMGSHGFRGIKGLMLGSVSNEVVTLSTVPVLIVR